MSLGRWDGGGGLKVSAIPLRKYLIMATLPPPKMLFSKKILTFLDEKCHFCRKFLGLLRIITNLQSSFKKFFDPSLPPRFLARLM